ncbi:MAG: hypothetical protein AB1584_12385, partial [Pseudomonadota bacterium]
RSATCLTAAILNSSVYRFPLMPSPCAQHYGSGVSTIVVAIHPGEAIQYKLELAERQSPWLLNVAPASGSQQLSDGTIIDLLLEHGGDSQSILSRFAALCLAEAVSQVIIVSPYWDANLQGFRELRKTLGQPRMLVALNPEVNQFPVNLLHHSEDVDFIRLSADVASKFVHAKLIIVQTQAWDHVLFGSANCSDDAMGYLNGPARNAEACIYRRYQRGYVESLLEIDTTALVNRKEIGEPKKDSPPPDTKSVLLAPGSFELRETKLYWWPPKGLGSLGRAVEVSGQALPLVQDHKQAWYAPFDGPVKHPLIARIRYANDELSSPAIVHCPKELKDAVPLRLDPKLREALEKAFKADGDLIELAMQAELIFATQPKKFQGGRTASTTKGRAGETPPPSAQYESEAAFRAAKLAPATGRSMRMFDAELNMQDLFALVTKGVAPQADGPERALDDEDAAILAGDTEDDVEESTLPEDKDNGVSKLLTNASKRRQAAPEPSDKAPKTYTLKEVLARRKRLLAALERFEVQLDELKHDAGAPLGRLPIQTTFVFALLRYGLTYKHTISDAEFKTSKLKQAFPNDGPVTLMVTAEDSLGTNSNYAFVTICTRLLRSLWTGTNPLGTRMAIHSTHEMLPDDIFEMVVASRWALARIFVHLKHQNSGDPEKRPSLFFTQYASMMSQIYTNTGSLGPIDAAAECVTIGRWDLMFGYTPKETEDVYRVLQDLANPAARA